MARLNKVGIDYFPFNVDFFDDDKIQLIESEFGIKGGYIAIRLLCKIYKEGYYYTWGADECLLFTKSLGAEGVSKNLVDNIIDRLAVRGFINQELFDKYSILTSKGIQTRYFEATKRYKEVNAIEEYLLVNVENYKNVIINRINVNINSENVCTNQQKKRKEKKRELITIKGKEKIISQPLFETMNALLSDEVYIETLCVNHSPIQQDEMIELLKTFFVELSTRGETYKELGDAKFHFANWLKIELEREASKKQKQTRTSKPTHPIADYKPKEFENDNRF